MKEAPNQFEWIFVGSFFLLLLSFFLFSQLSRRQVDIEIDHFTFEGKVSLKIEGAVLHPGTYEMDAGEPLAAFLKKAKLKKWADLRGLDLEEPIEAFKEIFIPEKQEIQVTLLGLNGALQVVVLPVGSKMRDLKSKVTLTSEVDSSIFLSRRELKDGEVIPLFKKRD